RVRRDTSTKWLLHRLEEPVELREVDATISLAPLELAHQRCQQALDIEHPQSHAWAVPPPCAERHHLDLLGPRQRPNGLSL
uniref:Uncharacterized protein n=1 Tax=Triticum urartu TaxID=4572 RepID=A0A8R7QPH9_TRIUA